MLSPIYFSKIKTDKINGLTLIELLVITIIVGVLASVSMPMLLNQIGKAREVELMNAVGTFNRSQQSYHWERKKFADGATYSEVFGKLGIDIDSSYVNDFAIDTDTNYATIVTVNNNYNYNVDKTRAYSGGIFTESGGIYSSFVCQSLGIGEQIAPPDSTNGCGSYTQLK